MAAAKNSFLSRGSAKYTFSYTDPSTSETSIINDPEGKISQIFETVPKTTYVLGGYLKLDFGKRKVTNSNTGKMYDLIIKQVISKPATFKNVKPSLADYTKYVNLRLSQVTNIIFVIGTVNSGSDYTRFSKWLKDGTVVGINNTSTGIDTTRTDML